MVSRIGGPVDPASSILSKDGVKPADSQKGSRENRRGDGEMEEGQDDVTFFSIDAIRALLLQEGVEIKDDVRACMDDLQRQGVMSIPIRDGQSILEAIVTAAVRMRGR